MTMRGGYSAIARELNRRFVIEPPVERRRVHQWHVRGTRNRIGQRPPEGTELPLLEGRPPGHGHQRWQFELELWVVWFAAGVPGPRRHGWRIYPVRRG